MRRSQAEQEVIQALMSDMSYADLVSDMVAEVVKGWDDKEIADFLWGDDDGQTIEND